MTFLKANPAFCLHSIVVFPFPIIFKDCVYLLIKMFVVLFSSNTNTPLLMLNSQHDLLLAKNALMPILLSLMLHRALDLQAMGNISIRISDET